MQQATITGVANLGKTESYLSTSPALRMEGGLLSSRACVGRDSEVILIGGLSPCPGVGPALLTTLPDIDLLLGPTLFT